MFIAILRSVCAGIASVVLAAALTMFVGVPLAMLFQAGNSPPGQEPEVGWDLITMWHGYPLSTKLVPALVFVVGFLIGFRYFSRAARRT
jgi:hypothetical protein